MDYSYDPNGNLLSLQRRGHKKAMLDNFKYGYYHGTNRLWHTAAGDGDNYQYDPIGNLIADQKEGTQISWNPYGKVRRVDKNGGNATHFRYDAEGNRIAKITDSDSSVYVRDASGNVMAVYKNDTLVEQSIYGSSRLGLHHVASRPGYRILGNKQYELSNHLGNVLAVVTDNIHLNRDSTWARVSSISDYYPFGLGMEGRSLQDSSYRYGFNGKENDRNGEWGSQNHYDYGFRIYNPSIAKFLSVDPLASKFPWQSPYAAMNNNPVYFIDPDGRAAVPPDDHYINNDGSIRSVQTNDNFDRFYVQDKLSETGYRLAGQLDKNDAGLVQFPASGTGFSRYGTSDAGGSSTSPAEIVGQGDHYLQPETAAALFGLVNKLNTDFGFNISLGDMSSSNGSDPWQPGFKHHAGHGHLGKRSGLDVDFRYLNTDGVSFQSPNAFKNSSFSSLNNQQVYDAAAKFGFTKNYQGTSGNLTGVTKVSQHNDHGHLGLQYKSLDWKYMPVAPIRQSDNGFNWLNR